MTTPRVTVAIPTRNRAKHLARQLDWAIRQVGKYPGMIEVVVADNASEDETAEVCRDWAEPFECHRVRLFRHTDNLGLAGNYRFCVSVARGEYVWVVGDDDPIYEETAGRVLQALPANMGVVHLNHRCIDGITGDVIVDALYPWDTDWTEADGVGPISRLLTHHLGGLMFISANVLRTDLALSALQAWGGRASSHAIPLFVSSFCGLSGGVEYRGEQALDCIYNTTSWEDDGFVVHYLAAPEVLFRLVAQGLPASVAAKLAIRRWSRGMFRGAVSHVWRRTGRLAKVFRGLSSRPEAD